jgi:hypothetical protein
LLAWSKHAAKQNFCIPLNPPFTGTLLNWVGLVAWSLACQLCRKPMFNWYNERLIKTRIYQKVW